MRNIKIPLNFILQICYSIKLKIEEKQRIFKIYEIEDVKNSVISFYINRNRPEFFIKLLKRKLDYLTKSIRDKLISENVDLVIAKDITTLLKIVLKRGAWYLRLDSLLVLNQGINTIISSKSKFTDYNNLEFLFPQNFYNCT